MPLPCLFLANLLPGGIFPSGCCALCMDELGRNSSFVPNNLAGQLVFVLQMVCPLQMHNNVVMCVPSLNDLYFLCHS
jgi:hypothetical protein